MPRVIFIIDTISLLFILREVCHLWSLDLKQSLFRQNSP